MERDFNTGRCARIVAEWLAILCVDGVWDGLVAGWR